MDIQRIKINGYKNLDNVNISFDKLTSLVSVNNYGKSNFLTGIIFGLRFIKENEINKKIMMEQVISRPLNRHSRLDLFSFEMEFSYQNKIIEYGYSFSWLDAKIKSEFLNVKDDSQKFMTYVKRDNVAYYKPSITAPCQKKIKVEDNELVINKLKAFDTLFYSNVIKEINQINMYIDRHFDVERSYGLMPVNRSEESSLQYNLANDNNIPMILCDIKKLYPKKYNLIINTFKDLFSSIKEMEALEVDAKISPTFNNGNPIGKFYTIAIIDKNINQPIDFNLMSDGARKILIVLTNLVLAEINHYSLVAIEELENSLNPKILQEYLIALNHFVSHVKVIITSHSPYLVNYLPPQNIYLGLPNDFGLAIFSKVKDNMINKMMSNAEKLNMYVGDYLFDLMSGGEEEVQQIKKYVE